MDVHDLRAICTHVTTSHQKADTRIILEMTPSSASPFSSQPGPHMPWTLSHKLCLFPERHIHEITLHVLSSFCSISDWEIHGSRCQCAFLRSNSPL